MYCRTNALLVVGFVTAISADLLAAPPTSSEPFVGEVRVLSVASQSVVDRLHQSGWIEARGEILTAAEFPELFETIGRSWTADSVPLDRFAVPSLASGTLRMLTAADNPYGVLGPGDMVTSGLPRPTRQGPLSCWIYAGRSVGRLSTRRATQ
jgi:hypothetical protein